MMRQSTPIPPTFQQGLQAPQVDIQKKYSVCMGYDTGEDGALMLCF